MSAIALVGSIYCPQLSGSSFASLEARNFRESEASELNEFDLVN